MASSMCKAMAAELGPERIVRAATLEIAHDTTPAMVAARVCAELRVRSGLDLEVSYSATGERLVRRYQSVGAALAEAASRATAQAGAPFPSPSPSPNLALSLALTSPSPSPSPHPSPNPSPHLTLTLTLALTRRRGRHSRAGRMW